MRSISVYLVVMICFCLIKILHRGRLVIHQSRNSPISTNNNNNNYNNDDNFYYDIVY